MKEFLIEKLGLSPHPEGGAFRETYRMKERVDLRGGREMATAIYFLLEAGEVSAWHRVESDELWLYHGGAPLLLKGIDLEGNYYEQKLGMEIASAQSPQFLFPAKHWQAAVSSEGWTLVSCVVVPGFDFADFEMASEGEMRESFPSLGEKIALRGKNA
ncbi:MAG TPA: cupin [Cyanobacteria bacterium UBA8530]|nr:cupin [Cyanobacteria bacterium UBA8530]